MSFRSENLLSLIGNDFSNKSEDELRSIFSEEIQTGIHGLCFTPYLDGQEPGSVLTEKQIRSRLEIIRPYTQWIRTFSCAEGNELIPRIAKECGLKTLVGVWLDEDEDANDEEMTNAIEIAQKGHADLITVGNEVLYREDLSEDELIRYIRRVKKALPEIQVGYSDAYYEFCNRPKITEACDVIFANCYPFWEGCHIDYSLLYIKEMYRRAVVAAKGKQVIISDTGWPNAGSSFEHAEPSFRNAIQYFVNVQKWCREDNIGLFYFSGFDEAWKVAGEGDVGAHWGLWNREGKMKYSR